MKWLKHHPIIYLLAIIKFALPFVLSHAAYGLHRDEFLYYAQGQHLALGYLECPPMIGWLCALSSLMGGSFFAIKFWCCFIGLLTVLLTAAIVRVLGGNLVAQCLAAIGIIVTAYMRVHFLFQPNILDVFFWTLAAYYLLQYIVTHQNKYLYLLSIALALGWYGKYSILFFVVAMIIALLLTKHRILFAKLIFWKAVLLGIVLIIPNLLWQYYHNFPLVHHMQELRETQLQYVSKASFLKDQLLMLLPITFIWVMGVWWYAKQSNFRFFCYLYLGIIVLLMFGSGKAYYALGAYPMLIAAGTTWLGKLGEKRKWVMPLSYAIVLLLSIPLIPVLLPVKAPAPLAERYQKRHLDKTGILKWEDQQNHALPQDFADELAWDELAAKAEKHFDSLTAMKYMNVLVYCKNYGQAGALQYYTHNNNFKNKVISDNGSFILWQPQRLYFKHLLFIGSKQPSTYDKFYSHFDKATIVDSITNPFSVQYKHKIIFFENIDSVGLVIANERMNNAKAMFQRQ
jgi:Dolichyl-phosphate-mannose-protein mannosyltransferase